MNHQASSLEQRVNQLEKQSRRMKLLLVGLPILALLLGAQAGKKNQELVLADSEGRTRVRLTADADGTGPTLSLLNAQGESIATLHESNNTGKLVLSSGQHPLVVVGKAEADKGDGAINFYDGQGKWIGGGSLE